MKISAGARGFSLLELLVALSIVALLMGMLMPALSVVRRSTEKANTENLMRKIDIALQGYRKDARAYPFYAGPVDAEGPWDNDLAYHLAHDLATDEASKLNSDLAKARTAYLPAGSLCIVGGDIDQPLNWVQLTGGPFTDANQRAQLAAGANRLGSERAVVGIMSGNTAIRGTMPNGGVAWNDRTSAIISAQSRGWAADYLSGELEKREISSDVNGIPESIIDYYHSKVVYVNPAVNGVNGFLHQNVNNGVLVPSWYGFQAHTRSSTQALASDIRSTAARAHVADYELWSAGRDLLFNAQRDHPANRDNISIVRYNRDLR